MTITVLAVAVAVGIGLVLCFRRREKRIFVSGRKIFGEPEVISAFPAALDAQTTLEVLRLVGDSYGIDYRKLRPKDCLVKDLSKADSWMLDAGAEKLDSELRARFSLDLPQHPSTFTISDLLILVSQSKRK